MIRNRKDYKECLAEDLLAWGGKKKPFYFQQFGLRVEKKLRKIEYLKNTKPRIVYLFALASFRRFLEKQSLELSPNCFGPGLYLPHPVDVIVHPDVKIGKHCTIQQDVTIGKNAHSSEVPTIGDNVFIGSGAKIFGGIRIADGVAIGANAVVLKDILEPNTTWAGVPARKISDKGSADLLPSYRSK